MNEFDLIKTYFATQTYHRDDVIQTIGDDAAVLAVPSNKQLVMTTDTLTVDVHFSASALPYDIGYKSLAVNLSDLAAMGAVSAWVTLALTLPNTHPEWLQNFCDGFFTLANRHQVQLVGGDTTKGPLSITVCALGFVPEGKAVLRSGAKPGDLIYVTGTLGDAGLALGVLQNKFAVDATTQQLIMPRLNRPEPRLETGKLLSGLASSAIDISDGLAADLNHILQASKTGAAVCIDQLPLSQALQRAVPFNEAVALALNAGDDYELCFTVPPSNQAALLHKLAAIACQYTCIGKITDGNNLHLHYQDGKAYNGSTAGYQHF